MPDRSNFNPDQLHAHFDRIKKSLGIEFVADHNMVQIPTGHRFGLGEMNFRSLPRGGENLSFDLHVDTGRIGQMNIVTDHGEEGHDIAQLFLRNGRVTGADPSTRRVGLRDYNEFTFSNRYKPSVETMVSDDTYDPRGRLHFVNPTAEQMDEEIAKIQREGLEVRRVGIPGKVSTTGGRSFGFNFRRKRYEEIPDSRSGFADDDWDE